MRSLRSRNPENLTEDQTGVVKAQRLVEITDQQILPGNWIGYCHPVSSSFAKSFSAPEAKCACK